MTIVARIVTLWRPIRLLLVIHALLRVFLRWEAALVIIRLWLGVLAAIRAGLLVDRRGIGGWGSGVLLLLLSGAVYVPSKRGGKHARIHVDDGD